MIEHRVGLCTALRFRDGAVGLLISCFFMRRSTEEAHVGEDKAAPLFIFSVRSTRAFNGQREAREAREGTRSFQPYRRSRAPLVRRGNPGHRGALFGS
jgi:hypothetical protein